MGIAWKLMQFKFDTLKTKSCLPYFVFIKILLKAQRILLRTFFIVLLPRFF